MKKKPLHVYERGNWYVISARIADQMMREHCEKLLEICNRFYMKQSVAAARKTDRLLRGLQ